MSKRRFQIYTFRCCVTTPSAPFYTLDTGVVPSRLDLQCVVHNDSRNLPIYTVYTSESKPSWSTACICAPPFTNIADMAWITTKNSNIPRPCTRTSPSCNSHTAPSRNHPWRSSALRSSGRLPPASPSSLSERHPLDILYTLKVFSCSMYTYVTQIITHSCTHVWITSRKYTTFVLHCHSTLWDKYLILNETRVNTISHICM